MLKTNGFPKALRLTTKTQFEQTFSQAKKIATKLYAIFYCQNNVNHPRLGLVVPKKSIRQANDRNTFKRVVRDSFRLNKQQLGSIDIIVLSYREAAQVSKKDLCQHLAKQWQRLIIP
jgi:ribonuclease P protein component